jgi:hypothetical protein
MRLIGMTQMEPLGKNTRPHSLHHALLCFPQPCTSCVRCRRQCRNPPPTLELAPVNNWPLSCNQSGHCKDKTWANNQTGFQSRRTMVAVAVTDSGNTTRIEHYRLPALH